jgi:hypothetical protein
MKQQESIFDARFESVKETSATLQRPAFHVQRGCIVRGDAEVCVKVHDIVDAAGGATELCPLCAPLCQVDEGVMVDKLGCAVLLCIDFCQVHEGAMVNKWG